MISMGLMEKRRFLLSSFIYCIILNYKHIYIYAGPAYFIYILKYYCVDENGSFKFRNFIKVSTLVSCTFIVIFIPFLS